MPYPEEAFVADLESAPAPATAAFGQADEAAARGELPSAGTDVEVVILGHDGASPEPAAPASPAHATLGDDEQQLLLPLEADAAEEIRSDPVDTPSFVRQAEREARWRRPRVRAALALASVAAGVLLAGQWLVAQRDLVAARSPELKPLLSAACGLLGCEVQAPRALEALRVESSGVVRVDKSDLYRLNVALRNLRTHEVALPAFELALTDTQGRLIARRVVRAGELGARVGALAAGAELALQGTIQVASGTVAGYTIELFYP